MKHGKTFQTHAADIVDYNELKNSINVNAIKDQGQAIAIPGQTDTQLQRFEADFFNELANQHDRIDLFVKRKADELGRWLQFLRKSVLRLIARCTYNNGRAMSPKRRARLSKYKGQTVRCGEDTRALQHFVDAQREAFRKTLKKYTKRTDARTLGEKVNNEILGDTKSFTRLDLQALLAEYTELLKTILPASTDVSGVSTPRIVSRCTSVRIEQPLPQTYWKKYDDGSDVEDEPCNIYIDLEAELTFPGSKTFKPVLSRVKGPVESVRKWFRPYASLEERQSLNRTHTADYFVDAQGTNTDVQDEEYASSSDFPSGYAAHYATFPSIQDQKHTRHRGALLFRTIFLSFAASLLLLAIASNLVATGQHRFLVEGDAGVIVGMVPSLSFATLGFGRCSTGETTSAGCTKL